MLINFLLELSAVLLGLEDAIYALIFSNKPLRPGFIQIFMYRFNLFR